MSFLVVGFVSLDHLNQYCEDNFHQTPVAIAAGHALTGRPRHGGSKQESTHYTPVVLQTCRSVIPNLHEVVLTLRSGVSGFNSRLSG